MCRKYNKINADTLKDAQNRNGVELKKVALLVMCG